MVIFFYPSATYVKVPPGRTQREKRVRRTRETLFRGNNGGAAPFPRPRKTAEHGVQLPAVRGPFPRPRKTVENTGKEYCKYITPPVAKIPLAGLPDLPCFQKSSFRKMDAGHIFRKFFCFVQTV